MGGVFFFLNCLHSGNILSNLEFYDNYALAWGGAILLDSSNTLIKNSIFINNEAEIGGAIRFLK